MTTKKKAASKRTPRPAAAAKRPVGRRAQNKATIRKKIVTAALSLFQTKGFDATTTKAIARKAGIAEGTVFNYFRTKEDIALHFFEQEVDQAIASVRDNPRLQKAPLEEKLFALVHSQLEFLAPYERFIGAAFIHALKPASPLGIFSHRAQELRHRYVGFVQELLDESVHASDIGLEFRQFSVALHRVERSGNDGQRRAQLVRRICSELALHGEALLEPIQGSVHS